MISSPLPPKRFTPNFDRIKKDSSLYSPKELDLLQASTCCCDSQIQTLAMTKECQKEWQSEQDHPSSYLTSEQRSTLEVTFADDGCLINKAGEPLYGNHIFALLGDHRLIAAPSKSIQNHSHLSAGLPVLNAGFIYTYQGYVMNISNNSGHYKPHLSSILHSVQWFFESAKNPNLLIEDHSKIKSKNIDLRFYKASDLIEVDLQAQQLSMSCVSDSFASSISLSLHNLAVKMSSQDICLTSDSPLKDSELIEYDSSGYAISKLPSKKRETCEISDVKKLKTEPSCQVPTSEPITLSDTASYETSIPECDSGPPSKDYDDISLHLYTSYYGSQSRFPLTPALSKKPKPTIKK